MIAHRWQPVTPLSEDCDYDFSEIDSLQRRWLSIKREREAANPDAYSAFLDRLTRSWAIETGIIEGLYTLDQGVTETLVTRGISAELIDQGATNKDPQELALMLDDHQTAAFGVYAEIREGNRITRSSIRQIHSVLTSNQPTFTVVDQFGNRFETQLDRGGFKTLPNNPTRRDGTIHEYCPPEHVDSELDNLLAWYACYLQDMNRYHPLLTAAWLHHRFTQIHPFQDGNGRVVRTLLTWHLVREGYLPIVVKRDDRADYIDALEKADEGDLVPFVNLLVKLQKQTILSALGAYSPTEHPELIDEALDFVIEQISRQNSDEYSEIRVANAVAQATRDYMAAWLEEQAENIRSRFEENGRNVECVVESGGPEGIQRRYGIELWSLPEYADYSTEPTGPVLYVELSITPHQLTMQPRLIFVVFLHHVRRAFSGIMAANVLALIEHYNYSNEQFWGKPVHSGTEYGPHAIEPFIFTLEDSVESLLPRLKLWTEPKLARALRDWGERFT